MPNIWKAGGPTDTSLCTQGLGFSGIQAARLLRILYNSIANHASGVSGIVIGGVAEIDIGTT